MLTYLRTILRTVKSLQISIDKFDQILHLTQALHTSQRHTLHSYRSCCKVTAVITLYLI